MSTEKANVYNADGDLICTKTIYCPKVSDKNIGQWLTLYKDKDKTRFEIGMMNSGRLDFQNQKYVFIDNYLTTEKTHALVFNFTKKNLHIGSIYYAVRHCIDATWLNDRDQFLYPRKGWESDRDFQLDCIVYTLFHGQNCISANNRANHWIPFTEHQLEITECFSSHFMQDYLRDFKAGKLSTHNENDTAYKQTNLFSTTQSSVLPKEETKELYFSPEAESVMEAGKAVYLYYHKQRNLRGGGSIDASLYDIKRYFKGESNGKMNATSEDEHFNMLMENMRIAMQALAKKIVPKVYEYEFLK